jgi:hypothetical protein
MTLVELVVEPISTSICYLKMSSVPRTGDQMTLFYSTVELGCNATVINVCWLISLDEENPNQSDHVVVQVMLDKDDPDYSKIMEFLSRKSNVYDEETGLRYTPEDKEI